MSIIRYDQLGRVRRTQQLEASATAEAAKTNETLGILTDTQYEFSSGHNDVLVSNPYNSSTPATERGWTVTRRDKAGRVCSVESFAGAAAPTAASSVGLTCPASGGRTGGTSTTYDAGGNPANTVFWKSQTTIDATGQTRVFYQDALGRTAAVVEDPGAAPRLSYATYYTYDGNDNLTGARQPGACRPLAGYNHFTAPCAGGTSRSFTYTSLSRLKTAVNPESGTINYVYDDSGNLTTRTHGLVTRTTSYDDLNRPTTQTYSDGTPAVTYTYDLAGPLPARCTTSDGALGRLASVSAGGSKTYYFYNKLGHVQCNRQTIGSNSYDLRYNTTPQGQVAQMEYPWGGRWHSASMISVDRRQRPTMRRASRMRRTGQSAS